MVLARPIPLPYEPYRYLLQRDREITADMIPRLKELGVVEVWIRHRDLEFLEDVIDVTLGERQRTVYLHVRRNFESIMRDSSAGIDLDHFQSAISELFVFLKGSTAGSILLQKLDAFDNYLMSHSANVCYLSLLLGMRLEQYLIEQRQFKTAREAKDLHLLGLGCLLHDIAHFEAETDYKAHGRLGARLSRPLLEELGYGPADIDNICYSIAVHVDGDAGYAHPVTLESKIVSDADNVDRFGAFRVLQWCVDDMHAYEALIEKLQKRILRLKEYRQNNPLETPTGQQLFAQQLDLQIGFFEAIITESTLTHLAEMAGER